VRQHAAESSPDRNDDTILPSYNEKVTTTETGGLDGKKDGRGSPSGSSTIKHNGGGGGSVRDAGAGSGLYFGSAEKSTSDDAEAPTSKSKSTPAPSAFKSEDEGAGDTALASDEGTGPKPPITARMLNGSKRFLVHMKAAICHSWVNVLLIFVPIGIVVEAVGLSAGIVFGMNAVAIVPLAGLLAYATESVASRLGDTLGALLNVSFGNAVELIIFIIALVKNEIQIVQASLLGSILANLLLILGMAFLLGGLRYREQIYNSTVTQMSACLLSLSVMSLLLPVSISSVDITNSY
jgi:Ca2+:H+ antiporter